MSGSPTPIQCAVRPSVIPSQHDPQVAQPRHSACYAYSHQKLTVKGTFGHPTGVDVARVRFLDVQSAPRSVRLNGKAVGKSAVTFDSTRGVLDVSLQIPFDRSFTVEY
ncbi:hypothetical protein NUW54_g8619 [Trametes sanguinea]|uniref:Uncharacterized protein n=1 Tax=Trametes sanguinea TaxID=158606 RepID=A0ACC1PF66_9APHY|nr:hypothetical protein NUW54_g8619 [Trametes sanguinea]